MHLSNAAKNLYQRVLRTSAKVLVWALFESFAFAASAPPPLSPLAVKQSLIQRGVGNAVKVTEFDGTQVVGTITAIGDDSFDITRRKTAPPITIPYAKVSELRNEKSAGAKVAKGVGITLIVCGSVAAAGLIFLAIALH